MTKSIGIHQPNYFPWIGYFIKISLVDQFVFLTDVPFSNPSYTKRVQTLKPGNIQDTFWLSVPVKNANSGAPIHHVEIDVKSNYIEKHLRFLENSYREKPGFSEVHPIVCNVFDKVISQSNLANLNILIILEIMKVLGINTSCIESTSLNINSSKEELVIDITKHLNGNIYVSGMGAKKYQKESTFKQNNINLFYLDTLQYLKENPINRDSMSTPKGLSVLHCLYSLGVSKSKDYLESASLYFSEKISMFKEGPK